MFERLLDYKNKCCVLKQIQSNKALLFKRINTIQNLLTIIVSGAITFIGFSGFEEIYSYFKPLFQETITIQDIQRGYNFLVFILFIIVIIHMVFGFNSKQAESERAISLLAGLINTIDDLIENEQYSSITSISDKYLIITQIIPTNTDREYLKAKKILEKKTRKKNTIQKQNLFTLSMEDQKAYIIKLINQNTIIQNILNILKNQNEELFLGGGIIRNLVWDNLHNYKTMTQIEDIDIIYYNTEDATKAHDITIEKKLTMAMPNFKWSVKNQARMHIFNSEEPYTSLEDAISKWPETASAVLIRKDEKGQYTIIAPFGFDDLFRLIVQPTPHFMHKIDRYRERIQIHNWQQKWSNLKILYLEQVDNMGGNTQQVGIDQNEIQA